MLPNVTLAESFDEFKESYIEWLSSRGAEIGKIELREDRDKLYRGLFAIDDIREGEQILFVPKEIIIMSESLYDTDVGRKIKEMELFDKLTFGSSAILSI